MDRKDEVIRLQMDIINEMTRSNLGRIADDLWGVPALVGTNGTGEAAGIVAGAPTDSLLGNPVSTSPSLAPSTILSDDPFAGILEDIEPTPPATQPIAQEQPKNEPAVETQRQEAPEKIEDLKKELNEYIGLGTVKKEVGSLINLVAVQNLRKQNDLPVEDISLHMVFSGNPGTGKTMIARLMSRIYRSLGILSKGQLVEVDRSGLVAGFVGQTAIKTEEVIKKALGGVLFIDEAYALTNRGGNDYGQEAVDTLLKAMEDHRDDLIVIVAGYIELMEEFVHSNPGLESRFNRFLNFADYTVQEMLDIFEMRCKKSGYELESDAQDLLKGLLALYSIDVKGFGNARGVRNLFERAVSAQANRLARVTDLTRETLMKLTCDDIRMAGGAEESELEENKEDALLKTVTPVSVVAEKVQPHKT